MIGDFNIHVNKNMNTFAMDFINLMDCFHLIQHVSSTTHKKGNTLDLVFTIGLTVNDVCIEDLLNDHKCVLFSVAFNNNFVPEK